MAAEIPEHICPTEGPCPHGEPDKYDTAHRWVEPCVTCKEPVTMSSGRHEAIGAYHYGCFGYPACDCPEPHKSDDCHPLFKVAAAEPPPPPAPKRLPWWWKLALAALVWDTALAWTAFEAGRWWGRPAVVEGGELRGAGR